MNDRSWMLNPQAIRSAKECIHIVKQELGVKLLLSHPEFVQMLHEYVELTESSELNHAYSRLVSFAGPGTIIKSLAPKNSKVVSLKKTGTDDHSTEHLKDDTETVAYGGKEYTRWRNGKEFSGVYRGQPIYS